MAATQDETIAGLQRANEKLRRERDAALAREAALAEVLAVINRSPGDPGPVFEAILEKAHRLCGADAGALMRYDGGHFHAVATHGLPDEFAAMVRRPFRGASHQRLIDGERIVHVADAKAIPALRELGEVERAFVDHTNLRTSLFVPLRKDDALLGFISADRHEVRPFSDTEILLLESFADQAVIAIENTRLLTEQREALEQQTATAEVLQVINASPGDLAPVFDAMLEKAMRLCGAAFGELYTFDGENFTTGAHQGIPAAFAEFRMKTPPADAPGSMIRRLREGANVLHIADVRADELYRIGEPTRVSLVDLGGARTVLTVALRKDESLLGFIVVYRQEVRPSSDRQVALLQNFAAQAVIAMENARLLTEQREALEQQSATVEVLQVINSSPGDLGPVFNAILEKAHRLCGATHGSLTLFDGERFRAVATYGHSEVWAERLREGLPAVNNPGTEPLLDGARFVHIADMADISHPLTRAAADATGVRTALFVPLRKDNRLIGAISAHRREVRPFTEKEIALLENFAAQAVIAMENARLLTEQREALEQQTATAEVLGVINRSPGDLVPVFDAMLEKAMRLCGGTMGGIFTFDGDHSVTMAVRGVTAAFAEYNDKYPMDKIQPRSVPACIIETRAPVQFPDVMAGDLYRAGHPYARALVELGSIRAVLAVPLLKDNVAVGMIAIYRQKPDSFPNKQIALLENFAAQAVIAMENARLLEEVRQREEELRITFENMGDGVAMFDEAPRLVAWNRKFQDILDLPDGVLAERLTFAEYIRYLTERGEYGAGADPEEQIRRLTEQVGQYRAYERVRPNGRVIEIRHNPVAGGGFVLIYADITERKCNEAEIRAARDAAEEASRTIEAAYRDLKAAQANLIQAEKMASLGQLTAGIAHEIKNPLNFVNNFAELSVDLLGELRDAIAPAEAALNQEQRDEVDEVVTTLTSNLEKITEHGKRAYGIVKAMLEHSRGSSAERRMVDLNAVIDEALNLAYHGARAQDQSFNITLERDFGEGIVPIEVNPQDITRAFLNMFSNGFYAATRRARNGGDAGFVPMLKVTTRDVGEVVEVRVRDNGTGIPVEIRDKLFQPFFTTKPTGEGTGLGLSITYDIVTKQHGGSITVESEVDAFTEFVVMLPRKMFANGGSRA